MADERDDFDPSDWLASQFSDEPEPPPAKPAEPVAPVQAVQPPVAPPSAAPPAQPAAPPFSPPPIQAPVQIPPAQPMSPAPMQVPPVQQPAQPPLQVPPSMPVAPVVPPAGAGGGFTWGLTPSSESPAPQDPPQVAPPAAPEPPPYVPPTPEPVPHVPPAAPEPPPYVPPTPEPAPYIPPAADPFPPFTPPPAVPAAAPPPVDLPTTAYSFDPVVPAQPVESAQPEPTIAFPQQQLEPHHPTDATQWLAAPLDASLDGATEVLEAELVGTTPPQDESLEPSALDSLFGEGQFTDYEGQSMIQVPPRPPRDGKEKKQRAATGPIPRNQKILMWVAGGLVAALALVALFMLGTRLAQLKPAPAVAPSPSPSASATGAPIVLGPVVPGEYVWDQLLGGECLEPWESAWQDRYTVVDCTKPNTGQMVHKGEFEDLGDAPYPGIDELAKRTTLLCASPTIINYAVAGTATDIQLTASFPADAEDWNDGNRTYYCFATRANEPFQASISMPQVAPTPTPLPTP